MIEAVEKYQAVDEKELRKEEEMQSGRSTDCTDLTIDQRRKLKNE